MKTRKKLRHGPFRLRRLLRNACCTALILFCAAGQLPAFQAEAVTYKVPFDVASEAVYLVNTDTGAVIYEKNADKRLHPASLTKIMTAILAIEAVDDLSGTMVTAPGYIYDEFAGLGVSTADIWRGETISMEDLLYALLLPSACEAASIIADYVGGGSIDAFVDSMNRKAMELGAKNTHFENAHGLDDPDQVSTARDMYLITAYAMTFPIFEKISSTTYYEMPVTSRHPNQGQWYIQHTNMLLRKNTQYYYEYAAGIKTGSTPEAGRNLASTASKGGYHYMMITMGAPYTNPDGSGKNLSFLDAVSLYDWAFDNFSFQTVMKENDVVDEIKVELGAEQDFVTLVADKDVTTLLPSETDASAIQQNIILRDNVRAPVKKGDVLGKAELKLADDVVATVELVALQDVSRSTWLYALDVTRRFFGESATRLLIAALVLAFLLYLIFVVRYNAIKQKQRERNRRYKR